MQPLSVIVWGTGNVGRPAIRAVLSHRQLELAGVVVANPDKVGKDAGTIAGVAPCGISATDDWRALLGSGADVVVYAANADIRPEEAFAELSACLEAGVNVVSTAFYAFLDPASTPEQLHRFSMPDHSCLSIPFQSPLAPFIDEPDGQDTQENHHRPETEHADLLQ